MLLCLVSRNSGASDCTLRPIKGDDCSPSILRERGGSRKPCAFRQPGKLQRWMELKWVVLSMYRTAGEEVFSFIIIIIFVIADFSYSSSCVAILLKAVAAKASRHTNVRWCSMAKDQSIAWHCLPKKQKSRTKKELQHPGLRLASRLGQETNYLPTSTLIISLDPKSWSRCVVHFISSCSCLSTLRRGHSSRRHSPRTSHARRAC